MCAISGFSIGAPLIPFEQPRILRINYRHAPLRRRRKARRSAFTNRRFHLKGLVIDIGAKISHKICAPPLTRAEPRLFGPGLGLGKHAFEASWANNNK